MTPPVSVIVLSYNYGRFLGRCLDSIFDQPYKNLEVIVVDDGSTDDTPDVVTPYVERGVRYIRKENGGVTSAVNAGVAAATGKYLTIISADDEWTKDRLMRPVKLLEEKPRVGLVYTDMQVIDADGKLIAPSYFSWNSVENLPSGDLLPRLFTGNIVSGGTLVCRTNLRDLWHPIPEYLKAEDWFIAFRVACDHEIEYVPVRGIRYRQHGQNMNLGQANRLPLMVDDLLSRRLMLAHPVIDRLAPIVFAPSIFAFAANPPEAVAALPVTDAQREEAIRLAYQAVELFRDRDFVQALRMFARSVAADPQHEQIANTVSVAWDAFQRRQLGLADVEARTFKPLAFASELLENQDLLSEYATAFTAADDATLLIQTEARDDLEALAAQIEALGSDADMVAVTEETAQLAAVADCLLSRESYANELAALRPVVTAAELLAMRARTAATVPVEEAEVRG